MRRLHDSTPARSRQFICLQARGFFADKLNSAPWGPSASKAVLQFPPSLAEVLKEPIK